MPFLKFEQCLFTECVELILRPATGVIENEAASLPIELFFLEKFSYPHSFDGSTSCMRDQELEALLLERRNAKLMRNVHQAFNVIPGNGAFQARTSRYMDILKQLESRFTHCGYTNLRKS
jgi:hypothetical protein